MKIINIDDKDYEAREVFIDLTIEEFVKLNNRLQNETDNLEYKIETIKTLIPHLSEEKIDELSVEQLFLIYHELTNTVDMDESESEFFGWYYPGDINNIKITRGQYREIKSGITLNSDWILKLPEIFLEKRDDVVLNEREIPIKYILPFLFKTIDTINLNIKLDLPKNEAN